MDEYSLRYEPDFTQDASWFETWIDHTAAQGDLSELLQGLWEGCLPKDRGGVEIITRFIYGDEWWDWGWNRAGLAFLKNDQVDQALNVYRDGYLCGLALQGYYLDRQHKGLLLSNLGVAQARKGDLHSARYFFLLALFEDCIRYKSPQKHFAYKNLVRAGTRTEKLVDTIARFTDLKGNELALFYPERALELVQVLSGLSHETTREFIGVISRLRHQEQDKARSALEEVWKIQIPLASSYLHG